jgi:hypothetical protein
LLQEIQQVNRVRFTRENHIESVVFRSLSPAELPLFQN